jgi:hypothetical protein
MTVQKGRIEYSRHHLLEIVPSQGREQVLVADHLSLLGDLDLTVEYAPWLGQDRFVRGPSAPAYRSAATVEKAQSDSMPSRDVP